MADPELDTGPEDPAPVAPDGPEGAEAAEGAEDAGAASEETVEERMLRAEATVASSDRGLGANDALRAMARAARSFLLYDPSNEAIKTFLGDYRDCCARALTFGTLNLEIRPFEMMLDGECVYLEKDRERSLAFRLYRDGVRRLTIKPEVDWSELLRLLEIMSIRYTGVRQQEDDVVTLLWKAGFKGIDIAAVEGFVPEEDEDDAEIAEARAAAIRAAGGHVEVPSDFDTPVQDHSAEREYTYRALTPEDLDPLKADLSSQRLPDHAIRLVLEMLELVGDRRDPTTFDDISALMEEVRLFLLEGQAAIYDDDGTARNGMARLGALLARDTPNTPTSFTLADTHLLFPQRLYNSFETPIKLIKARRCRARARAPA